ncbi:kelch domain-containing protein 2-like isoform X1 [Stegodyphus dumicola]|uniref:kelch domain-containing protein 2-like isoform X1 n=1 Tax=Stegodyphus dumicola TaxID=202533 RepID=UPI0015AE11AC|nr:kelch domain-containing protein 2-like isoform X1 [Stegodyphus dumicola]
MDDIVRTAENDSPPGRTGHIAAVHEKCMYVWGGYRENPGVLTNTYFGGCELWMYNGFSEKWLLISCVNSDFPPGMSGSAAVMIDEYLYLFGGYGYNGEGCTNRLYRLNLETYDWEHLNPTGLAPSPVDKMVGWQYKGKLYTFGGFGNPDSAAAYDFQFVFYHLLWRGWTNQFFEYDPQKNQWNRPVCTGNFPSARAAHAAAVMNGKVYIFGGRHDRFRLNDMHCLDMESMKWSGPLPIEGPIPEGRSWHSLTALTERYLILYGGFSQNNVALSDCWRFDTTNHVWTMIELPFRKPRVWHSACLNNYNEVLIYGGCTSNILDLERTPEQASDIIVIGITPKSLFRLCVNAVLPMTLLHKHFCILPISIQKVLRARFALYVSSNLDGS